MKPFLGGVETLTRASQAFARFVDRHGDRSGEVVWWGALALLERAAAEAREGQHGRWRFYPRGELRRLRRDVAHALELAHFAVVLQEEDNEQLRDLTADLDAAAAAAAKARRRAQTLPAEQARLAKRKRS